MRGDGDDSGETEQNIIILYLRVASIQNSSFSFFLIPADICRSVWNKTRGAAADLTHAVDLAVSPPLSLED